MRNFVKTIKAAVFLICVNTPYETYADDSANISPPPDHALVSPGGVDMRTGRYIKYQQLDLSIGDKSGGIEFSRISSLPVSGHIDPMGNFWHNWNIVLTEKRIDIKKGKYRHGTGLDYRLSVSSTNFTDSFDSHNLSEYSWKRANSGPSTGLITNGDRASSSALYTYLASDGSKIVFRPIGSKDCSTVLRCAYPSSVIQPDGTIFTLEYDVTGAANGTRLRSVTNNRGFALLLEYSGTNEYWNKVTKACVLNLAITPKPTNNVCPATAISASYTYSNYGSMIVMTHATDAVGAKSSFTYAAAAEGATNGVPADLKSSQVSYSLAFTKAGAPYPWQTLHLKIRIDADGAPDHIVGRQNFADGSSFSYVYETMREPWTDLPSVIAGGRYTNALGEATEAVYDQITVPIDEWRSIVGVPALGEELFEYVQDDPKWMITTPGPVFITDPLGRMTTFDYCDRTWDRPGCSVTVLQSATDPEGIKTEYWYSFGHLRQSRQIAKEGTNLPDIVRSSTLTCNPHAACGKPLTYTDPKGGVTNYTYDPVHAGMLTKTLPPATPGGTRPEIRYTYQQYYAWYKNSEGTLVRADTPVWLLTTMSECRTLANCAGTEDETVTTYSYGTPGIANNLHLTSMTVAAGNNSVKATTVYSFDAQGNNIAIDGPLSGAQDTTRRRYDALRREIGTITPDPDAGGTLKHRAVRNTYSPAGDLAVIQKGTVADQTDSEWASFKTLQTQVNSYDLMGRKIRTTLGSGDDLYSATDYSYDLGQRLECTAIRMNPKLSTESHACIAEWEGVNGPDRITRNFYNAAGELTRVQVAIGTTEQADESIRTYNLNGKLQTLSDAEGNLTTYDYDGHNRLLKISFPEKATKGKSSSTDFEQFTYDVNNNVTQRRLRDGQSITYGFDALNRQVLKDLPNPESDVSSTYTLQGKALGVTQGNSTLSFTWDALGRNLSETGQYGTMSYQYDEAGRRTRTTWPDGFYTTQEYFVTGEVAAIREYGSESGLVLATYEYDDLGLKRGIGRANGTRTNITYDNGSRLISLSQDLGGNNHDVASTFAYNPANQIITWTRNNNAYAWTAHSNQNLSYGINGLNQITLVGNQIIEYDGRGNLTSKGTPKYGYSIENRLLSGPDGASYSYDPTGRLSHASGSATRFQYDGTDLVTEYNSAGQVLRRYVHGPGADEPLVWYEGSGTSDRRWLHQDERGSTIAISNSTGAATTINSYDEFGVPAPTNAGRFQYTGQTWLAELGMYYYKARIYDPKLGRFLQTDPVGYEDQLNMYAYVGNDPVNATDPTGMFCESMPTCAQRADEKALGNGKISKDEYMARGAARGEGALAGAGGAPGASVRAIAGAGLLGKGVLKLKNADDVANSGGKTFQTYTKTNPKTGQVYCGRTSGCGTPEQNIARRDTNHHMNQDGYGPAVLDKSSANSAAIRGREQQLIDAHGGAQSTGGTSGNRINGISTSNQKLDHYLDQANKEFGG